MHLGRLIEEFLLFNIKKVDENLNKMINCVKFLWLITKHWINLFNQNIIKENYKRVFSKYYYYFLLQQNLSFPEIVSQ